MNSTKDSFLLGHGSESTHSNTLSDPFYRLRNSLDCSKIGLNTVSGTAGQPGPFSRHLWASGLGDEEANPRDELIMRSILARVDKLRSREKEDGRASPGIDASNSQNSSTGKFPNMVSQFRITRPKRRNLHEPFEQKSSELQTMHNSIDVERRRSRVRSNNLIDKLYVQPEEKIRSRKRQQQEARATFHISAAQSRTALMAILNDRKIKGNFITKEAAKGGYSIEHQMRATMVKRKDPRQSPQLRIIQVPSPNCSPFLDWILVINWSNGMHQTHQTSGSYRALLEKGNNSLLVKMVLKSRPWWNVTECNCIAAVTNFSQYNLVWSQNKHQKFMEILPMFTTKTYQQNFKRQVIKIQSVKQQNNVVLSTHPIFKAPNLRKILSQCQNPLNLEIVPKENYQQYSYTPKILKVHNHLEKHRNLSNKKSLFKNLRTFYQQNNLNPFEYIPLTFHVESQDSPAFQQFSKQFTENSIWIIKPGQNTNRGHGIELANSLQRILEILKKSKSRRTFIIQQYLKPCLYQKRKFDIRCYILVTSNNRMVKGYWYDEGYVRTSCATFSLENIGNKFAHLTNDAVQKKSAQYGKHQPANKLSFEDLGKYLESQNFNFWEKAYPEMISRAKDCLESTYPLLDPYNREHSFQIFGLDFMLDENRKVWLIQVNTNPCLEVPCSLLGRIIPSMLDNALRIALDPILPPTKSRASKLPDAFSTNKFTLIFNRECKNRVYQIAFDTQT